MRQHKLTLKIFVKARFKLFRKMRLTKHTNISSEYEGAKVKFETEFFLVNFSSNS
jgi:hypothetical protein